MLRTGFRQVIGSWKIIVIRRRGSPQRPLVEGKEVPALEQRPPRERAAAGLGQQAHQGEARDALARAALADDGERLAARRASKARPATTARAPSLGRHRTLGGSAARVTRTVCTAERGAARAPASPTVDGVSTDRRQFDSTTRGK